MKELQGIAPLLLDWYDGHARILPWRENPTPYRVWVSEIMLQQTRVEAVKPYFERFIRELPAIEALASVPEDRLLKIWEGLGYYNRARNMQKAARIIVDEYNGKMPEKYEEVLKLPGIGSYTAGAIVSIAFGLRYPAVDGNVLRVLSRVEKNYDDILKQSVRCRYERQIQEVMPEDRAGDFNQSLIELGAITCVPKGIPRCDKCGGVIKPDVVLYEESLDEDAINGSIEAIRQADMLIVGGTSLNVYPAAGFVSYYKGSRLVLINKSATSYDKYADLLIHDSIGKVLSQAVNEAV